MLLDTVDTNKNCDNIVLAPMVMGSELAFRMAVRRYGIPICYSPMLRAEMVLEAYHRFLECDRNRDAVPLEGLHEDGILFLFDSCPEEDSQLVVQLCGHSPNILSEATLAICDYFSNVHKNNILGVDLNLGCPQKCAQDGLFGAFLAENDPDLALQCIRAMKQTLIATHSPSKQDGEFVSNSNVRRVNLSCKIRLRSSIDDTIQFAKELQDAGCNMLTVHCRQRETKHLGEPDLKAGKAIVEALAIPVIINGGIVDRPEDIDYVLNETGSCTAMVARAFLFNHRLMKERNPCAASLAAEYLFFAKEYPPPSPLYIRRHLRWIFRKELQHVDDYSDWRCKLWRFLVRPYLEDMIQFEMAVVLYVHHRRGCEMPDSLKHINFIPTFQGIRHHRQDESDGEEFDDYHANATLNLFQ